MEKKRILFIAPLPPPIHGSSVVSQQIKDSNLIKNTFNCDWVNLSTSRNINEIGKRNPAKLWRFSSSLGRLIKLLITHRYDLCYVAIKCHDVGFLKDVPFVLLCKFFNIKIIIHQHNKGMSKDLSRFPYRWFFPIVYKKAKVILLSWYLYQDIEKVVPRNNILICPNGLSVNEKLIKSKEYSTKDKLHLLFLGNLIESKGVFVLLDALSILRDKGYSFICNFVGGETKEINSSRFNDEIKKRGLESDVYYLGKKYGDEKDHVFNLSDIFVYPTSEDCFPLVLLEAMFYGLPCVTTTEGGIPDIVADGVNGIICNRNDSHSLADSISVLLDNKELCKQMGDAGRKLLFEKFTEEKFEKNLLYCLETAIN